MKKLCVLFVALLLAAPAHAKLPGGSGTTYYVGTAGCSDSNNGTSQQTPWCTVGKVNGSTFNPGDVILFQGGATFSGTALQLFGTLAGGHFGGTSISPVTVGSYGTGRFTISQTGSANCIQVKDTGGLIVRQFTCTSTGNGLGTCVQMFNDQGVLPRYDFLIFDQFECIGFNGVDMEAWNGSVNLQYGFSNVSFTNCAIHDFQQIGSVGIFTAGSVTAQAMANVFIDRCQVYHHAGDGIDLWFTNGGAVRRTVIHDGGGFSNSTQALQLQNDNAISVEFSEIYNQASSLDGNDAGGCDLDQSTSNSRCQYLYIHGNAGPCAMFFQGLGSPWYNNTFRYSVCENNAAGTTNVKHELSLGAGAGTEFGIQIYGIAAFSSIGAANANAIVGFNDANAQGTISNSIFLTGNANPRLVDAQTFNPVNIVIQGNDYSGGATNFRWNNATQASVSAWATAASKESYRGLNTFLTASPSLTSAGNGGTCNTGTNTPVIPLTCPSAYQLQAGSAMLNAGQNLKVFGIWPGLTDYFGNSVPAPSNGNYDVGANQRTQ